ncbi:hypothetical protein L9F63_007546, partial [Diploptera punctata]
FWNFLQFISQWFLINIVWGTHIRTIGGKVSPYTVDLNVHQLSQHIFPIVLPVSICPVRRSLFGISSWDQTDAHAGQCAPPGDIAT